MQSTNTLIEFRDTPEFRQRLAAFIGASCQVALPDIMEKDELLHLATARYRRNLDAAVHRLILFLEQASIPILDLHEQCERAAKAVRQSRFSKAIIAKWAMVPAEEIEDYGHDAEAFRARGGRYIEAIGVWITLRPKSPQRETLPTPHAPKVPNPKPHDISTVRESLNTQHSTLNS